MKNEIEKLKREAAEEDNDLKAMGIHKKISKLKKSEWFNENVLPELEKKFEVICFQENSYRIKYRENTLDFYPISMKSFIHKTRSWKKVERKDLFAFIDRHLILL